MYECVFCLYVCLCTTCMRVAWRVQKRALNSWNLSCGWLWTTKWMLGIEPRFSARTSVLNQWAIFPVSIFYILITSVLFAYLFRKCLAYILFLFFIIFLYNIFYTIYFLPYSSQVPFPYPPNFALSVSFCLSVSPLSKERHKSKIQNKQKTKNAKAEQKQCSHLLLLDLNFTNIINSLIVLVRREYCCAFKTSKGRKASPD